MANLTTSHNLNIDDFRHKILSWYDKHQRTLPWRVPSKGEKGSKSKPNPYYVWLSEIMLQQTTVVTVGPYFHKFIEKWPTVHDLASAIQDDVMHEWAGLGYYARARNLHKCAKVVSEELDGVFPQTQKELEELPGIGGYTSAAVRAIAFNKPANVVDGNIERVMARIYAVTQPMPDSKPRLKELAAGLADDREDRPGDYAQALMDLGSSVCTPKSPRCMLCPVREMCLGYAQGIADTLPARKAKKAKPQKHGHVYWIENKKGEIAFERRDEKEMLGGMLGLPTSNWIEKSEKIEFKDGYEDKKVFITHSFTHFDLKLHIQGSSNIKNAQKDLIWMPKSKLSELGLPTLFKKVVKLMN